MKTTEINTTDSDSDTGTYEAKGVATDLKPEDIKVGHLYRGKRYREKDGYNNDRVVLHITKPFFGDPPEVQYDSYTVPNGRHYPTVSMEKFLKWAKEDITGQIKEAAQCSR